MYYTFKNQKEIIKVWGQFVVGQTGRERIPHRIHCECVYILENPTSNCMRPLVVVVAVDFECFVRVLILHTTPKIE